MPLKLDYYVKETSRNLFRSPWLTTATVVTVAVALALVGIAFLVRTAVDNTTGQWEEGIELIIYMQPDASGDQVDAVSRNLEASPQVESFRYLDHDEAYEEIQELFRGENFREVREILTPDDAPTNFKVRPTSRTVEVVQALQGQFEGQPGVRETVAANDTIRTMQRLSRGLSIGLLIAAGALAAAALVLVANTIQTAMFARRREIEVMKLVGATNWFIRVPFMLEGVTQGLIGAAVGVGGVYGVNQIFDRFIANAEGFDLVRNFVVDSGDVLGIAIGLILGGVVLGALASAAAVTFYLDV